MAIYNLFRAFLPHIVIVLYCIVQYCIVLYSIVLYCIISSKLMTKFTKSSFLEHYKRKKDTIEQLSIMMSTHLPGSGKNMLHGMSTSLFVIYLREGTCMRGCVRVSVLNLSS